MGVVTMMMMMTTMMILVEAAMAAQVAPEMVAEVSRLPSVEGMKCSYLTFIEIDERSLCRLY